EILMIFSDAIMDKDQDHQTPHDIGKPQDDPFFRVDAYGTNRLHWKDLHSKFIQQCWRYYHTWKDKKFLDHVWPACKATYEYLKSTDKNKDKLPDNHGSDNTYDVWGLYGTSLLCGGLWVASLEAMKKMAAIMKDPLVPEIDSWLKDSRKNLDQQLWMEEKGYYRIDTDSKNSTAIMSDGLNGQRYCERYQLPDILPVDRMRSHLKQVFERCVKPMKDYDHDGYGDVGAINGLSEKNELLGTEQSNEVWAGSSYFLAASMYHMGLRDEALHTAYGVFRTTYLNEETAYWFNTPEAWDREGKKPRPDDPEQYQRARAVWELLCEIDDPYKK
ncbi:MAG: GH116 family glycosyl hydrolase, partial [bacterium]|nr:GH116 family glycosyl hydrolase [bacterium]